MRSSPTLESAAFASGFASGDEVVESSWVSFPEFFQGVWVEILIVLVALALYIHLRHVKQPIAAGKSLKVADRGRERQALGHASKKDLAASPRVVESICQGDESQQVSRLVVGLLQKSHRSDPGALLKQYGELVMACGSNLRQHISDDSNARSMYLALIGCAVAASGSATEAAPAAAVRRWTARLFADMRSFGFPRSVDLYAAVLKLFTSSAFPQEGLWLYDAMVGDGLVPSNPMLICLLNVAVSCGECAKALTFFEGMVECEPPSLRTIMTVVRAHSASRDWRGAAKLLDRMESLGTPPDNLILNNVLGLCISVGQVDGAEQLLRRWTNITDVISFNILLKGCAQQGDLIRSAALLDSMISDGPAPNIISYNTVMDGAVRSMQMLDKRKPANSNRGSRDKAEQTFGTGHQFSAVARRPWELLDQLISQGLEPDRYTCSTLVKGMHLAGCSSSDIDRAVDLVRRIGPDAIQAPSTGSGGSASCNARLLEVLFNTLLDACITVRDLDRMAEIFAMMQQFKVSVSAVTYGTLIKAFGQASRVNRCHEVWEDMRRSRIHPTIVTYGCYIDACIRNDDTERAEEIFESMMATPHGAKPNAVIYTCLIRGFAHAKQPSKALAFYRRMQEQGIEANSVTFNSVLDLVARQLSEPAVLQEVIDDMCKASMVPDAVTYSILIKASCNSGNVQNGLSLFRKIQSRGLVFDQVAFNTLLHSLSKANQMTDAEDIFEEMRRVGVEPTHVTASIMVKMYGKAKMLEKAVDLIETLEKEYGQKPNLYVYTCLIQACVQNKQVRRSWDVFNRMVESGVVPDAITYGTVIHGCVYLNKFAYAMGLVRHAFQRSAPAGIDSDTPFVATAPLKQAVPLQLDVLKMLLAALQRKSLVDLATELEDIMASGHATPPAEATKPQGGKYRHR